VSIVVGSAWEQTESGQSTGLLKRVASVSDGPGPVSTSVGVYDACRRFACAIKASSISTMNLCLARGSRSISSGCR